MTAASEKNIPVKINIPEHIRRVISALESNGFEAWCVGGCVRDSLLGRTPGDWDITATALPQEIKACFPHTLSVDTGIKHGTVSLITENGPVEITTLRSDGDYTDSRHPDSVRFTLSLKEDLARRDFTVNAMAYRDSDGLTDIFGGRDDLSAGLLRCVGDHKKRFSEDALRILRCIRFSSVLGFDIDKDTERAAEDMCACLARISGERISEELTKLICGKNAAAVLRRYSGIIFTVLPELAPLKGCTQDCPYHRFDVWEHSLHALENIAPEKNLRLAALLHDCGKPSCKTVSEDGIAHFYGHVKKSEEIARSILSGLRISNRDTDAVCKLISLHGEQLPLSEARIKKLLNKLDETEIFRLYDLIHADISAQAEHIAEERIPLVDKARESTRKILEREDCFSLKDLEINGRDLISIGFAPGPALGKALSEILELVMEGKLENDRSALLNAAERKKPR